ncbi:MAG: 16S rRNA (cytosine(1402)-N(4))-methyltransferase RsmH [Bacteroidia bacterium]
MTEYHNPVLLKECLTGLDLQTDGIYVDATFGGGGHSAEILKRLGEKGRLIAFDQDEDAVSNAFQDPRFTLVQQNFRYLKNFLKLHKAIPVDGILADLGVSSHQFDIPERGFSTRFEADLDMRMDRKGDRTAASVLNESSERELIGIFRNYGEVLNAPRLARVICEERSVPIRTVDQFKGIIAKCVPRGKENQYLAQVFQALRIEVNEELVVLKEFLLQSTEVLKPKGRLVVISYHSLEDRLVKNYINKGNFEGEVEKDFFGNVIKPLDAVNRKIIVPQAEELQQNNRARSARLRIAEKRI